MVNEQGFNPSQLDEVNDVVQRSGFSDRRRRNLAIRSGMENPGAFQEQNAGYIQEAQQPSEFVGAGRKLASNQNVDSGIANLFGGALAKHGTDWYSYGDTDYSGAQFGTNGYNTKDLVYGKYDILDSSNNSLGTGYSSVKDAISAYANANRTNQINSLDPSWTPQLLSDGTDSGSYLEFDPRNSPVDIPNYHSALGEWEALGQMINGSQNSLKGYFPTDKYGVPYADHLAHNPHNNRGDLISGLNTLYGSTPLIMNDKLLGYKMDLGPGSDATPFSDTVTKQSKKEQMNSQLWRKFQNEDEWGKLTQRLGTGQDVFVPTENAEKLPGWTNEDKWDYQKARRLSSLGGFMSKISPILKMTPLAPIGYFADFARGLETGNYTGSIMSILSQGMNMGASDMAGMAGVDQMPGGGFSGADLADFSSPTSTLRDMFGSNAGALLSAGMGALSAGKGVNPLYAAAGAGLGSMANGSLQGLMKDSVGDFASKIFGGAASRGINSLFNQNQAIHGSEQGTHSGSLSGFINNNSPSAQNTQQEISPEEKQQLALDLQRKLIQRQQQAMLGGA